MNFKIAFQSVRWILTAPITLAFDLLAILLFNWWVIFFARPGANAAQWLPSWLGWFQTFDASLDAYWTDGYVVNAYTLAAPPSFWRRKYWQWCWLNRNTGYSFAYYPLGAAVNINAWTVRRWNVFVDHTIFIATSAGGLWNVRLQGKYGAYNLGWKMWNYWDDQTWATTPWGPVWRTQIVISINPFKRTL
jgi:hypothetical protein